nr:Mob [Shuttle vector pME8]
MSYAVCRMQKVKSAGLKGMQFHNQRERKSRTNDDIDHERTRENYDLKNDKNIDYNERVKEIIESQKTGTRKTRKDAVLVNELLVTSDRDFFEQLDRSPGLQEFDIKLRSTVDAAASSRGCSLDLEGGPGTQLLFPLVRVNFELGVIMVIAVSCVKLLSAHNSTQHTSRKHKV